MENSFTLHGLTLPRPEGFHEMDEAEWSGLRVVADGEGIGLSDPERHMILTLGYKRVGGLAAAVLSVRDLARNAEKQISRPMAAFGYGLETMKGRQIGGREAQGFRYGYTVGDVGMTGESYVVKDGREIYYLHAYMRAALLEDSQPVWERILETVTFQKAEK